jgi:hypothetical protein
MFLAEQHGLTRKKVLKKKKREQAPALQRQLSKALSIARSGGTKSRGFLKILSDWQDSSYGEGEKRKNQKWKIENGNR